MNNDQFRRLVLSGSTKKRDESTLATEPSVGPSTDEANGKTFGMAPRTVKGTKQFKSIAPKGSKFATGYQDRALSRRGAENVEDEEDKAKRIAALEKSLKDGELDSQTFNKLRDEITGGQLENTHLVKGLDWKLLERVRKGEDLNAAANVEGDANLDSDEEFETLEKKEVQTITKEKSQKVGNLVKAPPPPARKTRDQILAELKASRKRAAESTAATEARLGTKFRRIGEERNTSRIEIDEKGREVLLVTDANGNVKRKVRKSKPGDDLLALDKNAVPLGADVMVPEQKPVEESDDDDIYADVGDDYDPLAALGQSSDSSSDEEDGEVSKTTKTTSPKKDVEDSKPLEESIISKSSGAPRNYFNDDPSSMSVLDKAINPLKDPQVLAALSARSKSHTTEEDGSKPLNEQDERLKRRAAMLSGQDRDLDDMDMGFGSSRFDDAEEMALEGSKVKLSEWGEDDDDDDGKHQRGDKSKRKRPAKKRKGDKNSMTDVMRVIEGRKK